MHLKSLDTGFFNFNNDTMVSNLREDELKLESINLAEGLEDQSPKREVLRVFLYGTVISKLGDRASRRVLV